MKKMIESYTHPHTSLLVTYTSHTSYKCFTDTPKEVEV